MIKFARLPLALVVLLGAAPAFAEGAQNPVVKERQDLMDQVRQQTGKLGDMASGKAAFDAAVAAQAKTDLAAAAAQIVAKFQAQEDDPKSESTPAIWANFADYTAKAEVLVIAAETMDASSLEGVKAGMAEVGPTCRACHQTYRAKR